jgi:predicted ArsR family transcriptional regulator
VSELTDAKRRIVERLKRLESATAPELAAGFELTDTAMRQHLEGLEALGLVERSTGTPSGRGRPPLAWRLTALAHDLFPDRHAELTLELIDAVRTAVGEDGLQRVLDVRAEHQLVAYRKALPDPHTTSVKVRVRRLAELRSSEGYLAEAAPAAGGTMVLVEHHCPISGAAHACTGLCQRELELFREVLGDDVVVERTQHLVAGDQRCAYLVRPR